MFNIFSFVYKQNLFKMLFITVCFIFLWIVIAGIIKRRNSIIWQIINFALLLFSIGMVLFETLNRNGNVFDIELIPFHFLIDARVQPEIYRSMFMNALLFVPLGLFMPFAVGGKRGRYAVPITVLFSAMLSAVIEFLQYRFHLGRCETDDVIFNTLGAAVGTLSYCLYMRILKNQEKGSLMQNTISDSQKLLLDLCAKSLFDKNIILPDEFNSKELIEESKRQTVFPCIYSLIKDKCDDTDGKTFSQIIAKNIRVEFAHNEVHRVLSEIGIPYVILKGVASASYYKEPMLRMMGDVDVLVAPENIEKADELLKSIGFVTSDDINSDEMHIGYKRKDGISCELHRRIGWAPKSEVGDIVNKYFSDIFEKSKEYNATNGSCILPDKFHHGLILLLHTASHLTHEGVGLRHLCDWAVFYNSLGDDEFCAMFEQPLKSVGLWEFARALTAVCARYLGAPEIKWASGVDNTLTDALILDVLNGGNFGKKDIDRYNQIKFIANRDDRSVDGKSPLLQLFHSLNQKAKARFSAPALRPVGWIAVSAEYLYMLIMGKRSIRGINKTMSEATLRKSIYERLQLFKI